MHLPWMRWDCRWGLRNSVPFKMCNTQNPDNRTKESGLVELDRPNGSKECSIRFKPEEHAGHSVHTTASFSKMLSASRGVWNLARSYMKII